MDKIEKIRQEIERLKSTNPSEYNYQNAEGYIGALDDLVSFLDTLPEEPVSEELEEAARQYGYTYSADWPGQVPAARDGFIAGAEWGADHLRDSTKMVDKGLEEAAEEFSKTYMTTGEMTWKDDIRTSFIAGAKWQEKHDEETIKTAEDHAFLAGADWQKKKDDEEQAELFTIVALDAAQRTKEKMMKGSVEGEIVDSGFDDGTAILKAIVPDRKYDSGDKVKLIVIKED